MSLQVDLLELILIEIHVPPSDWKAFWARRCGFGAPSQGSDFESLNNQVVVSGYRVTVFVC